jgi:hypothetical protein
VNEWRYSSTILHFHARGKWVVCFTLQPLCSHVQSPPYTSDKRLGGSHRWSGRYGEKKNVKPLPGIELQLLGHLPSSLELLGRLPRSLLANPGCHPKQRIYPFCFTPTVWPCGVDSVICAVSETSKNNNPERINEIICWGMTSYTDNWDIFKVHVLWLRLGVDSCL